MANYINTLNYIINSKLYLLTTLYKDDIAVYTYNHSFLKLPEIYVAIK